MPSNLHLFPMLNNITSREANNQGHTAPIAKSPVALPAAIRFILNADTD
jgi:hypothetical protein